MKVLLTGATGFVGSHILDQLRTRQIPVAVVLRANSNPRFIQAHLSHLSVIHGDLNAPECLRKAMHGVTHVVHCAGLTRAIRSKDFHAVNQEGTRHVVEAANTFGGQVRRLIHVSSLSAVGPVDPGRSAREEDAPHPVSEYGRSKQAGEEVVRTRCQAPFVILRPPAVYGPRDQEFLRLFKAVSHHVVPKIGTGKQALSLLYVEDLAKAVVHCLDCPTSGGHTWFVASSEVTNPVLLTREIARQWGSWAIPFPVPLAALWPLCTLRELVSRATGKPSLLSREKFAELKAPAWVCDGTRFKTETGFGDYTPLSSGIGRTLQWYRREKWL